MYICVSVLCAESQQLYADRSKMADGVDVEICCSELDFRRPFKLPEYCSIFQAEVFAINIWVDGQAAIKAVISQSHQNALTIREGVYCRYWVPAHI